ncbi:MAG: alginate export family protein [Glaciecola sp.]
MQATAQSVHDALSAGSASVDLRLRYEGVEQDNAAQDASAFTVRTRVGYQSGDYQGFSFNVELEDNRIALGEGDYTVGPAGYNPGIYSVIADPEFTELDQGYVQYKSDAFTVKLGRQVITHDGHRFIGHVGWRQDRQTFDGATVVYAPTKKLKAQYSYITQRNRIFGEFADLDAKDHLMNVSYQTDLGKVVGYAYLLEVDNATDNALDTYGVSFKGAKQLDSMKLMYGVEYASQTSKSAGVEYDTSYMLGELGANISGITAKLSYEVLGSDNGMAGFATPLATLHKFNGWSDQFLGTPAQGLQDMKVSLAGGLGGGKWMLAYHNFEADESTETVDDLGSEINAQYTIKLAKKYAVGIKYADYSSASGRVDASKTWIWLATKF